MGVAILSDEALRSARIHLESHLLFSRMSIRLEQYDGGEVLYIALDPDGVWARSDFPDELITVDYNAQGGVIGIEVIGSLARSGAAAMVSALTRDSDVENPDVVRKAFEPILA